MQLTRNVESYSIIYAMCYLQLLDIHNGGPRTTIIAFSQDAMHRMPKDVAFLGLEILDCKVVIPPIIYNTSYFKLL